MLVKKITYFMLAAFLAVASPLMTVGEDTGSKPNNYKLLMQNALRSGDLVLSAAGDGMILSSDKSVQMAGKVTKTLGIGCHAVADACNNDIPKKLQAIRLLLDCAGVVSLFASDRLTGQAEKPDTRSTGLKAACLSFSLLSRLCSTGADLLAVNEGYEKLFSLVRKNNKTIEKKKTGFGGWLRRWGKKALYLAGTGFRVLAEVTNGSPIATKLCSIISGGVGAYDILNPQGGNNNGRNNQQQAMSVRYADHARDHEEKINWFKNELRPNDDIRPGYKLFYPPADRQIDEEDCAANWVCAACLDAGESNDCKRKNVVMCPNCKNIFHKDCLYQWCSQVIPYTRYNNDGTPYQEPVTDPQERKKRRRNTCPCCRKRLNYGNRRPG